MADCVNVTIICPKSDREYWNSVLGRSEWWDEQSCGCCVALEFEQCAWAGLSARDEAQAGGHIYGGAYGGHYDWSPGRFVFDGKVREREVMADHDGEIVVRVRGDGEIHAADLADAQAYLEAVQALAAEGKLHIVAQR